MTEPDLILTVSKEAIGTVITLALVGNDQVPEGEREKNKRQILEVLDEAASAIKSQ